MQGNLFILSITLLNPHEGSPPDGIAVMWDALKPHIAGLAMRAGRR